MTPMERYRNDPIFHRLVEVMVAELHNCTFTPTELREAVILATILLGEREPIPRVVENWLHGVKLTEAPDAQD